MIPPGFLDELRARTPLRELVARRVSLKKSGREWVGSCCFHTDKTPSLFVYPDHYHCFGCGAHGDAIDFVRLTERLDFHQAVEKLAVEAGLEVPGPEQSSDDKRRTALYDTLQAQAELWAVRLWKWEGARALEYLRSRGLTDNTIRHFGIGWAERDVLPHHPDLLRAAGLTGDAGPLFRYRIVFPIHDMRGRVIGFSGRVLDSGQTKYLNSPETELFAKRRALYGLHHAKRLGPHDRLVVVEGQLDVAMLQQSGIPATAPLGTALTEEQLESAWSVCPRLTLAFDGDLAGQRSTHRAINLALPLLRPARTLRVTCLPGRSDPASLIQSAGTEAIAAALGDAQPLGDALFIMLRQGATPASPEASAEFRRRLEEAAAKILDRALAYEFRRVLLAKHREWTWSKSRRTQLSVVRPGMPVRIETERTRFCDRLKAEAEQAYGDFVENPTKAMQTRYLALCEEHTRAIVEDIQEEAEYGESS